MQQVVDSQEIAPYVSPEPHCCWWNRSLFGLRNIHYCKSLSRLIVLSNLIWTKELNIIMYLRATVWRIFFPSANTESQGFKNVCHLYCKYFKRYRRRMQIRIVIKYLLLICIFPTIVTIKYIAIVPNWNFGPLNLLKTKYFNEIPSPSSDIIWIFWLLQSEICRSPL